MVAHGVLPVCIGGLIYVGWRTETLAVFSWLHAIGVDSTAFRSVANAVELPRTLLYCLPGGLWAYSFSWSLAMLWGDSESKVRKLWLAVPWIAAVSSELGQLVQVLPGTFDLLDLVAYVGGCGGGLVSSASIINQK